MGKAKLVFVTIEGPSLITASELELHLLGDRLVGIALVGDDANGDDEIVEFINGMPKVAYLDLRRLDVMTDEAVAAVALHHGNSMKGIRLPAVGFKENRARFPAHIAVTM